MLYTIELQSQNDLVNHKDSITSTLHYHTHYNMFLETLELIAPNFVLLFLYIYVYIYWFHYC